MNWFKKNTPVCHTDLSFPVAEKIEEFLMRFATSPRLLQAGREEREAKLRDFVAADLANHQVGGANAHCYTLLARAPDSPVARAVATLSSDLAATGIAIRALLLDLECFTDEPGRVSILDIANVEVRLLSDARFTAAHEQLVLSPQRLWLGDCMRRDPAKRDAFEIFHEANAAAAAHAMTSFSRLWMSAQPVQRVRPLAPQLVIAGQMAEEAVAQPAPRR